MYSFDQKLDRRGFSKKWDNRLYPVDEEKPLSPMWIADMDFAVPDCVLDAIRSRLEHPTLGYCDLDSRFAQSAADWARTRWGALDVRPEYVGYQNSAMGGVVTALRTFTEPGDSVLVHVPVYTGFIYGIAHAGCRMVGSPLVRDQDGIFRMDLDDMERRITEEHIKCMIICSPHNPTGRVWSRQELEQLGALCEHYAVSVISDEVWADFVFKPARYLPTAAACDYLRRNTVTVCGASKTFNLSGLHTAYSIVYDDDLRRRYQKKASESHYNSPNTLSAAALIGAYSGGHRYVDELTAYIRKNMRIAHTFISQEVPAVKSYLPEGTYNMWLDFTATGYTQEENIRLLGQQGLIISPGSDFNATGWFRVNLAAPKAQVECGLEALKSAFIAKH